MAKYQEIALRSGETIRLTEKELLFCNYYLGECNRNGTQAAIRAGYAESGAKVQASRMLTNANIKKYIDNLTAPILEACGVTNDRIIKRLRDLAFTDLSDVAEEDWSLKDKSAIKKEHHAALGAVEVDEKILMQEGEAGVVVNRKVKYKIKDSTKALITLAEMAGLIDRKKQEELPQQPQQINNYFQQINNHIGGK